MSMETTLQMSVNATQTGNESETNALMESVVISKTDLDTKEHGHQPVIRLMARFTVEVELNVSKTAISEHADNIMKQAEREVRGRLWRYAYGGIWKAWPELRHDIILNLDPMRRWEGVQEKLDAFAKLFRRPA